jgi:NTP pyrophosphatase (non-canonical NTP hydrolase)
VSDLEQLTAQIREFARARDWEKFHTPKNLSMALAGEVGELLAELQWLTEAEAATVMSDAAAAGRIRGEMADVFIYLIRLADILGVDLLDLASAKLAENELRFDVAMHYGKADKAPPLN